MLASVVTAYGGPEVLTVQEVERPEPGPGQIRIAVRLAGVGATDLAIRAGRLQAVFPLGDPAILGFEAAGVIDAVGPDVTDVAAGDEVSAFLPGLGGYAERVIADHWTRKPPGVDWADAAAAPASGEAAVRVLKQLGVAAGETLLVLGGGGAVGTIATQLAVAAGVRVFAAVRKADFDMVEQFGGTPIDYHELFEKRVDAVFDASGRSDLPAAIRLAGGPERVITLADHRGPELGVALSGPDPAGATAAITEVMGHLAGGRLKLRPHESRPLSEAAKVHAALEAGELRSKILLRP